MLSMGPSLKILTNSVYTEPVRTVGTKRQARESLDGGFKKVARTTAGKKFAAIKEGLQTMVIDDSDLDEPEEPSKSYSPNWISR